MYARRKGYIEYVVPGLQTMGFNSDFYTKMLEITSDNFAFYTFRK